MDIITIIVAGIVGMAVGWAWYSPVLFGKPWTALSGESAPTEEQKQIQKKSMPKLISVTLIAEFVTAFVVYKVLELTGTTGFLGGAELVLLLWLGLIVPIELGQIIWRQKPLGLFFIAASQDAVKLIALAAVFALLLK